MLFTSLKWFWCSDWSRADLYICHVRILHTGWCSLQIWSKVCAWFEVWRWDCESHKELKDGIIWKWKQKHWMGYWIVVLDVGIALLEDPWIPMNFTAVQQKSNRKWRHLSQTCANSTWAQIASHWYALIDSRSHQSSNALNQFWTMEWSNMAEEMFAEENLHLNYPIA